MSFEIDASARKRPAIIWARGHVGTRRAAPPGRQGGPRALEPGSFDVAFVDGVKGQYVDYLELVVPLLRAGGVLTVDNVLMSGTVAEKRGDGHWTEEQIEGMRMLNEQLLGDSRLTAR